MNRIDVYRKAIDLAGGKGQIVGEKSEYYITLVQLEQILMLSNLTFVENLVSAWKDGGNFPERHEQNKARILKEWPVLYMAMQNFVNYFKE